MRAQSLLNLSACAAALAGSSVSESAYMELSLPPIQPNSAPSLKHPVDSLKHGQLSPPIKPAVLLPLIQGSHAGYFVGNSASDSSATSAVAQQLADRIEDTVSFVFSSSQPPQASLPFGEEKNGESPLAIVALTLSDTIVRNLQRGDTSIFLVSGGSGSLAMLGAIERSARELSKSNGSSAKELLSRVHWVLAGSFAIPEEFTPTAKLLGSMFEINVVDTAGKRIDGFSISDAMLTKYVIPCVTPEMFHASGSLSVTIPNGIDAPRTDQDKNVADAIAHVRLSRAQDQIRRSLQEIQHLANQKRIDDQIASIANTLEELRMLTYTLDELDVRYDAVIRDLESIRREQRAIDRLIEELAKSNAINQEHLFDLKDTIRAGASEIIRNILNHPREPAPAYIRFSVPQTAPADRRTLPTGLTAAQIAADFDTDGVPDSVEETLLERFRPILALNAAGNRVPISVTRFRQGSEQIGSDTDPAGYLRIKDLNMETPESDAIWYGRVIQPRGSQYTDSHRYIVQYFSLYPVNTVTSSETWTTVVNALDGTIGPLIGFHPKISVERGYVGPLGGHQGDVSCVDFLVELPSMQDLSSARIIHGVYHNHGRQFFMEGAAVETEGTRPIVYSEVGTQELHPHAGPAHEEGFARDTTSNDVKDGMFDSEDYVIAEHHGRHLLKEIPVFNVGEVECSKNGLPVGKLRAGRTDQAAEVHQVDHRVFNDAVNKRRQAESKFLLEYPGDWGGSKYRLDIRIEIPLTGWGKTVFSKPFGSPTGPVFSSAEGSVTDSPFEIDSKMWTRRFKFDGGNVHADAVISTPAHQITDGTGVTLSWPEIPYALGYLVTVRDSRGNEFLYIPEWDKGMELRLQRDEKVDYSRIVTFRHDKITGRRPDREYTYKVAVIWSNGVRDFLLKKGSTK